MKGIFGCLFFGSSCFLIAILRGETPADKKSTLRIGSHFGLKPLNPITSLFGNVSDLVPLVSDGLVLDYSGKLHLASSIESENGSTWNIRIRDDVRFHDGRKLTADDVVHSIRLLMQSNLPHYKDRFDTIQKFAAISQDELTITLSKTNYEFRTYLTFPILPKKSFPLEEFSANSFLQNPIGTGPFKLVSFGEKSARFERFEDYFLGRPKLDAVEFVSFPTKEETWSQFIRGKIDVFYDPFADAEDLRRLGSSFRQHLITPPYGYYLTLATKSKELGDSKVRKAIELAVDRRRLKEMAPHSEGPEPEWVYGNPQIHRPRVVQQDVKGAEKLLDETNWSLKKEGFRFMFPLRYIKNDEVSKRVARLIEQNLYDVGIKADLRGRSISGHLQELQDENRGGAISFFTKGDSLNRLRLLFHSSGIQGGLNTSGFSNPMFDYHLDQAIFAPTRRTRIEGYQKSFELLKNEVPSVFLFWRHWVLYMDKCWEDVTIRPGNLFRTVWKWHCV